MQVPGNKTYNWVTTAQRKKKNYVLKDMKKVNEN